MPLRATLDAPVVFDNPMAPLQPEDYGLPLVFPVQDAVPEQSTDEPPTGPLTKRRLVFVVAGVLPLAPIPLPNEGDLITALKQDASDTTRGVLLIFFLAIGMVMLARRANPVRTPRHEGLVHVAVLYLAPLGWPFALFSTALVPTAAAALGVSGMLLFLCVFRAHYCRVASAGLWSAREREPFLRHGTPPAGIKPAPLARALGRAWLSWATYNDRGIRCATVVTSPIGSLWSRYVMTAYTLFYFAHAVSHFLYSVQPAAADWLHLSLGKSPALNALFALAPAAVAAVVAGMAIALLASFAIAGPGQTAAAMEAEAFAPERWNRLLLEIPWVDPVA